MLIMRKFFSFDHIAPWMAIAFGIWVFAFWGFLSARLSMVEDALAYYDRTKFFINNLAVGVFPLWDPDWYYGAPNDFFLQRIGAYNPFYLLIVFLRSLGVSHTHAYLSFLATYYLLGMVAFYLLVLRVYKDRLVAFTGFLLLLFSALGTRLFDSYMMLVTIPIIWFFYFLVAFTQSPSRGFFLGMVLAVLVLLTTYIPFYFLIFLMIFMLCFVFIFPHRLGDILGGYFRFIKKDWKLVLACAVLVIASMMPLAIFYNQSSEGSIALPGRHGQAIGAHVLTVAQNTLKWGTLEDILYSSYFSDLQRYKFAIIYVPFFAVILLLLGMRGRINRRFIFIFSCAIILLCIIIPQFPFHAFLYKYLFFMKYFRNLHFFLWFVLIPLFVLLALESLKLFLDEKRDTIKHSRFVLIYTLAVHGVALFFVWWRADAVISTYLMIGLSGLFFTAVLLGWCSKQKLWLAAITLIVVIQPLEVYYHLSSKGIPLNGDYKYYAIGGTFKFVDKNISTDIKDYSSAKGGLYYASKAYHDLYLKADNYALSMYLKYKLILTDALPQMDGVNPSSGKNPVFIEGNSPLLRVEKFNSNYLRLATNLPSTKFLVYNDSYDARWRVYVNGKQEQLHQVNGAFKGVWVPQGHAVVEFRFGDVFLYAMHGALLIAFYLIFVFVLFYWVRQLK